MRRVLVTLAAATAALTLVPMLALSAGSRHVVPLGERANGTTVRVRVGDVVKLTLPANASTGYAWAFSSTGRPVLHLSSTHYVPTPTKPGVPVIGAPGAFLATLTVRQPGRRTVTLAYRRHTRPATPPARRFSVTIVAAR